MSPGRKQTQDAQRVLSTPCRALWEGKEGRRTLLTAARALRPVRAMHTGPLTGEAGPACGTRPHGGLTACRGAGSRVPCHGGPSISNA